MKFMHEQHLVMPGPACNAKLRMRAGLGRRSSAAGARAHSQQMTGLWISHPLLAWSRAFTSSHSGAALHSSGVALLLSRLF